MTSPPVDHVIVGAGTAGCVLAGRLAAGGRRVLLLEAGPDGPAVHAAGASFFDALAEPGRTEAGFSVVKTEGAMPTPYQLGRGVGGGSAVNAMIATPGVPEDYDRWAREFGCDGWDWASLRWTIGAMQLGIAQARLEEWGSVDRSLVESAVRLGHPRCADYLADGALGVGPTWLTRTDGRRMSTADAYLPLGGDRLEVRGGVSVDRVVFTGDRAIGVLTIGGELIEAGEVVLCAGAIHSPAILLRSGVERDGIGAQLKDHPSARFTMRLHDANDVAGLAAATLLRWSSSDGVADLQVLPLNHLGSAGPADVGGLVAAVMAAHSTGSVTLASNDPAVSPLVALDLLGDERDRRRLREAARHMARLVATEPMVSLVETVFIDDAGTTVGDLAEDDDELDRWLLANVGDYFHASGTCRMGPPAIDGSVVDLAGRVHGRRGVRVCDTSIFPDLPRANPYLPTVMVAEQIAAMVLAGR